jgi:hypothetical protein
LSRQSTTKSLASDLQTGHGAMFGDIFSQRGDYSKGIMYGSRRKYLVSPNIGKNHFSPPTALMTKRQQHRAIENNKMEKKMVSLSVFQAGAIEGNKLGPTENHQSSNKPSKVSLFQRSAKNALSLAAKKQKDLIIIEKFSTTERHAWAMELQAGCKIFINKETGEVCDECPWSMKTARFDHLADIVAQSSSVQSKPVKDESEFGTGHLVYDEGELDSFFSVLDAMK